MRSSLEYADVVWDGCSKTDNDLLEGLQIDSARLVTGAMKRTNGENFLRGISWVELSVRRKMLKLEFLCKMLYKPAPHRCNLCPLFVSERSNYHLCSANDFSLPFARTERYKRCFLFPTIQLWNDLPSEVRLSSTFSTLRIVLPNF